MVASDQRIHIEMTSPKEGKKSKEEEGFFSKL